MANVMSMKNLRNKVSRNGFDMSERRSFTAKVGEILPCFVLETIPGDHITINPAHFTRTMPVNTAAYAQIKEFIHYYFVPYRLLHSGLDAFFSDTKENPTRSKSLTQPQTIQNKLPYLSYRDIADYIQRAVKANAINDVGMSHAETTVKLLSYLGYGDFNIFLKHAYTDTPYKSWTDQKKAELNIRLSPLTLLAYQKIYQDYFRNKQWEKSSPQTCNIDYQPFNTQIPINSLNFMANIPVNNLFSMRYCDYNKDYFFGLLPNAQYGDYAKVEVDMTANANVGLGTVSTQSLPSMLSLSASVIAIRKAEALQKYKEIKQSGDQDYQSHLEKIFNVSVSDDRSDKCRYLGGYDSQIDISEVVNTNLTSDDSVADIKGKGISSGGSGNIEFNSSEFGVIIGIYTSRPMIEYSIDAPIRANTRVDYDDFANPVFDRIGMETVSLAEMHTPYLSVQGLSNNLPEVNSVLGYAPRYYSYKTNYDKVLGEFKNTLSAWVAPMSSKRIFNGLYKDVANSTINYKLNYRSFKVHPNSVDSIFVQQVDNTTVTDQLLVKLGTSCPIVRNLDYDGLPY